jgi:hypothetical protein
MLIFSAEIGDSNAGLRLSLITANSIYQQISTKSAYPLLRNADNLSIWQQPCCELVT